MCLFVRYKNLKLKRRVFLAGHTVAMINFCVTKTITTCSPIIGQLRTIMIVASPDKEWKKKPIKIYVLEIVSRHHIQARRLATKFCRLSR